MPLKIPQILLLCFMLVLLPVGILTYRLTTNPPGFFIDESIYGYEAYSIMKTGGSSSNGELLPRLFLNPGETVRNHGSYTYFIIPFLLVFGTHEFSVRITTVIASIGILWILYFSLRDKVSPASLLLVLVCWPFTAWVFLLSRIGMEFIPAAFFYALSFWLLYRLHTVKKEYLFQAVTWLGITLFPLFYIYAAGKLLAAGVFAIGLLILLLRKVPIKMYMLLAGFFLLTILLSVPYIRDGSFFYRVDELKQCKTQPYLCIFDNLLSHFSYTSYFADSYTPKDFAVLTHSIQGTSLLPRFLLPFLLVGIGYTFYKVKKKDMFSILLLLCSLLAIIPASLTIRGFDSYRSVALLPMLFIYIVFGMHIFLWFFRRSKKMTIFVTFIFAVYVSLGVYREAIYLFNYEIRPAVADYGGWQYGYKQVFTYLEANHRNYRTMYVTPTVAYLPELYIRFFDPEKRFPNITVGGLEINNKDKALYVVRPYEASSQSFVTRHVIYYPDGVTPVFYIGELR